MELKTELAGSSLASEMEVLRAQRLNSGMGMGELLSAVRQGHGFPLLFKELVRVFGQESTRVLLKRHGYLLGSRQAGATLLAQAAASEEHVLQSLIGSLQVLLPDFRWLPEHSAWSMGWYCSLGIGATQHQETRIDQENALLWLLTGYAAGYLNQCFDRNYLVTYARQMVGQEVAYQFFARVSRAIDDFDQDLLLRNFKSPEDKPLEKSERPAPPAKPAYRILRAESELAATLRQVAVTDATVLLLGESGVGKSLVASELHAMSPRAQQAWVEINCAALPEQLIESELFGVERGAFSGATLSRKGKFEQAHGGTIFLDEVGLLSPAAQSKLLRVLQSGEFERLGSNATICCDIRVIAATNEPLEKLVREGRFREDLYYRLNVFPVRIPSLRERKNEIPVLVSSLMRSLGEKYRKKILRCNPPAREILLSYDWPGNIRELENVLERAVILCPDGGEIQPGHLGGLLEKQHSRAEAAAAVARSPAPVPTPVPPAPAAVPAPANAPTDSAAGFVQGAHSVDDWADAFVASRVGSLHAMKDAMLRAALRQSNGNLHLAAASLGMTRGQLNYQLKKMNEQ